MTDKKRNALNVVICWHMHQPQYANSLKGEYQLPWTYLHAIKDYTDMAAHLEAEPRAKAVVNFAPILLEQLLDYSAQIKAFLETGKDIGDRLLSNLATAILPADLEDRIHIVKDCMRLNRSRMVDRYAPFKRLIGLADWYIQHQTTGLYINNQFLIDLLVWYHLAWMGETVRRSDERIQMLIKKQAAYTYKDRRLLVEIIGELVDGIISRYKSLADSGQIELSLSPYAHPIVPLMIDLQSTLQAMPDASLPALEQYPQGRQRALWHIQKGVEVFRQCFAREPVGCWPSEGSVSSAASALFEECGFKWIGSGENVLKNSLHKAAHSDELVTADAKDAAADEAEETQDSYNPHQAFKLEDHNLLHFFRDDGLSDMVGFTYSDWHGDDAVANLVHHLENIAENAAEDAGSQVVSIILDGENAWEYYPENGFYFLSAMYKKLAEHPRLRLTTFSDCAQRTINCESLPELVAGSWVYGTFSTWIGDPYKNRAWEMLGDAKACFDKAMQNPDMNAQQREAAERQMAICEGSDWFWWFGDYNPSSTVCEFDRLFRMQLVNLYQILAEQPPEYLSHGFAYGGDDIQQGGGPENAGTMRRAS